MAVFYFFLGLLCGFFLGVSLEKETSGLVAKLIFTAAIWGLVLFSRRLESIAHKHTMQKWAMLYAKGKWYFILTRYVLFRGVLVLIIFLGPFFSSLKPSGIVLTVLLLTLVPLLGILFYMGHEEWVTCEQEYSVALLRQAAQEARQDLSFTN